MKRRVILLYAAYVLLAACFGIWQYRSYQASFETIIPYQHPGTFTEKEMIVSAPVTQSPTSRIVVKPGIETTDATEGISYPLDLNSATIEELCTLPGIGPVIAQAICDYRKQIGGFRNRMQLLEVHGIGEARYQALLPYLWLEEEFFPTEPEIETIPHVIPVEAETEAPSIPVLNLNTVMKTELMLLPGCTEELAENILYLRDVEIHLFYNPLELLLAEGVTDALFKEWQPYLAVDDEGGTQIPWEFPE